MECRVCAQPLMVAHSSFESDAGSTEVYQVMTLVCVNPKCANSCGGELNDPLAPQEVVRYKVN